MKGLRCLALAVLVIALGVAGSAFAQECDDGLFDTLGPTLGTYTVGETIEYTITISIPPSPDPPTYCTLIDMDVYFFPPPGTAAGGCDDPTAGVLIGTIPVLAPGDAAVVYTSADNAALAYIVQAADIGGEVRADMAVTFFVQGDVTGTQQCDEKTSVNFVECPDPCIEIRKEVDCDVSKVGDVVEYMIGIRNCGDYELTDVVVTDPHISPDPLPGFPTTLAAMSSWQQVAFTYTVQPGDEDPGIPFPDDVMMNQASVAAIDGCDGTTQVTETSELVYVALVDPSFTVTKECVDDPLPDGATEAWYDIVITNTGDIPLKLTTDEASFPDTIWLDPGQDYTDTVSEAVPAGVGEVCNTINVSATLPQTPDLCFLQNVLTASAGDCCGISGDHGCTPGYWKNQTECWCETYETDDLVCEVFTVPSELEAEFCDDNDTLHEALSFGGGKGIEGKARNLLRHGVAALLNACDPDVNYPVPSPAGVITMVNDALASLDEDEMNSVHGTLEGYNELGCPQDAHCNLIPVEIVPDFGVPNDDHTVSPTDSPGIAEPFSVNGYPNPAGPSSMIRFTVPADSRVTVEIIDVQGRTVDTLADQHYSAGSHSVAWNGEGVPSGVYFARVKCCAGKQTMSKVIKVQ